MEAPGGPQESAETAAFRRLHAQSVADVWRFARRRCATDQDADDVAAEVFSVAWRRRSELPPEDDVRLWLFGTARNVLANQRRSGRRQERLVRRLADDEVTRPSASPAPDHELDRRSSELWSALASLGDDDRDLLLLRAWDGLAVTEIARLIDCSPNAASLRIHKARNRLAAALAAAGAPETDPTGPGHVRADPPSREAVPDER